jgi:predicted O-methyltransferase YrrM
MSWRKAANRGLRKVTGFEIRRYQPPSTPPKAPATSKPPARVAPTLHDFTRLSVKLEVSPTAFLEALGWPADEVAKVADEFDAVMARLEERCAVTTTVFPPRWGVEAATGVTLYALTRLLRPTNVVETGVADGRSSFLILSALDTNEHGTLHSFDVNPEVGSLTRGHPRWELTISPLAESRANFTAAMERLDTVDLFLHDSDHGYPNQMFEYEQAWPKVPAGGVLASDDTDLTKAYVDFAAKNSLRPHFLFDSRKVLGAIRR